MSNWTLVGYDRKEAFERELSPNALQSKLKQYQEALGKEFGVKELLEMERIQATVLVAEAINDFPEFLVHQLGIQGQPGVASAISEGLDAIADALYVSYK